MNKQLLKYVIARHNETAGDLAKYLGISTVSLSAKMNEKGSEFKQKEIAAISERYQLTGEEIKDIFFSGNVS